jgi:hypothetical protein
MKKAANEPKATSNKQQATQHATQNATGGNKEEGRKESSSSIHQQALTRKEEGRNGHMSQKTSYKLQSARTARRREHVCPTMTWLNTKSDFEATTLKHNLHLFEIDDQA